MMAAAPAARATSRNPMHVNIVTPTSGVRSAAPFSPQLAQELGIVTVTTEALATACRRSHRKVLGLIGSLIEDRLLKGHEYAQSYLVDGNPTSYRLTESGALKVLSFFGGTKTQTELLKLVNRLFHAAGQLSDLDEFGRTPDWQKNRNAGKVARQELSQVIEVFVEYAKKQGSENGKHYYGNITQVIYKALFPSVERRDYSDLRSRITDQQLALLAAAEHIAERALNRGMEQQTPYKEIFAEVKQAVNTFGSLLHRDKTTDCSATLPTKDAA